MTDARLNVLLVEDQAAFADLLRDIFTEFEPGQFALVHVNRLSEAAKKLQAGVYDVVLLDLALPDETGMATYHAVRRAAPATPVIVLTGSDDEALALEAMRNGAQDYLVKGQLEVRMLGRVVRYAIERKRSEETLRQSEQFFRLISENMTDLIAVLDCEGRRLYHSPSYEQTLGHPSNLTGSDSFEEIHPDDRARIRNIFAKTIASGVGQRAEYRLLLGDGTLRHIESQGSAITDTTGRTTSIVVVSRDITDRKQSEEALRRALAELKVSHETLQSTQARLVQSEKLEAVSAFAAGVAHEVKNPLQAIILGVDYLSGSISASDPNAGIVLTEMNHAVYRADSIIQGLLELAPSTGAIRVEDLSSIVEQALNSVRADLATGGITIQTTLSSRLPPLRTDARTMKHVFINLLLHAARGMPYGGQIGVTTAARLAGADGTRSRFKATDEMLAVEIEQIPRSTLQNEPAVGSALGQPSSPKGNGLGLTVLRKILELYGGRIELDEDHETGVKILITFKADIPSPPPARTPPSHDTEENSDR